MSASCDVLAKVLSKNISTRYYFLSSSPTEQGSHKASTSGAVIVQVAIPTVVLGLFLIATLLWAYHRAKNAFFRLKYPSWWEWPLSYFNPDYTLVFAPYFSWIQVILSYDVTTNPGIVWSQYPPEGCHRICIDDHRRLIDPDTNFDSVQTVHKDLLTVAEPCWVEGLLYLSIVLTVSLDLVNSCYLSTNWTSPYLTLLKRCSVFSPIVVVLLNP